MGESLALVWVARAFVAEKAKKFADADALFARGLIEWNSIGYFQDVTLRCIAQRLLPEGLKEVFVMGELVSKTKPQLRPPAAGRYAS